MTLDLVAEMRSSIKLDLEIEKKTSELHNKVLLSLIQISDLNEVFSNGEEAHRAERKQVNV